MNRDADYHALLSEYARASAEHLQIELRSNTAMVLEERPDSKPTAHVLFRGMYDQPRELVDASTPAPSCLRWRRACRKPAWDWRAGSSIRPNPLFSRVTVTDFWQEFFGAGILESTETSVRRRRPRRILSCSTGLPWSSRVGLGCEKVVTLIVTSATYRQSAAISDEKLRKDPKKHFCFSRGPRFRLDGEVVRDSALAASGLLVPTLGGPPVKPYQPAGVWEGTSMVNSNTGTTSRTRGRRCIAGVSTRCGSAVRHRRRWTSSMGPRGKCAWCGADSDETQPLQALVTMNDPQFVEAARTLAQQRAARLP
jgi:hypothetical protein